MLLGTALLLLIAYSVLLAVMAVPETADAELPMLALAYGLSRPLGYVYGVLLLLCMYGSALSMTVAITTYASARSERVEKRRGWFILALGALGYAASSVGFGDLISVAYSSMPRRREKKNINFLKIQEQKRKKFRLKNSTEKWLHFVSKL